jgi:hypothetical protein
MISGFRPHRQQFLAHARSYLTDSTEHDAPYLLKIDHTFRVTAHSLRNTTGLPSPVRLAAALSALYHDLGRFSQLKEFGTFHDGASINHAQRSVSELERLAWLPPGLPYREEIITAIRLHNQKLLTAPLSPVGEFFYHLLRDCDKTDVLAVLKGHYLTAGDRDSFLTLGMISEEAVTPTVLDAVLSGHIVDIRDVRTRHDFKLLQLGWITDIHYLESYRFMLKRQDFQDILAAIPSRLLPPDFHAFYMNRLREELQKKKAIQGVARAAGLA